MRLRHLLLSSFLRPSLVLKWALILDCFHFWIILILLAAFIFKLSSFLGGLHFKIIFIDFANFPLVT